MTYYINVITEAFERYDAVVYTTRNEKARKLGPSDSAWMVPGTWRGR